MTSVEPTEIEQLCGRVLGIIGAYGMGDQPPGAVFEDHSRRPAVEAARVRDTTKQQPHAAPAA